jgi:phosphoglycolate phosphatase-like HAD superfamily hydrolase
MSNSGLSNSSRNSAVHIWDFDGVLCESLTECLTVLALAIHRREHPGETITRRTIARVCSDKVVAELDQWMRPLRPFIVRGQDYLWQYDAKALLQKDFGSRADYDAVMKTRFSREQDDQYTGLFYESRELLAKVLADHYLSLFTCQRGAVHALRLSLSRHQTFICTNRDRQAIELVMKPYQIELPRHQIYSKDFNGEAVNMSNSKLEQVHMIIEKTGGAEQAMVLIEDQPELPGKLIQQCPNLKVLYAAYGYGLEEDWARLDSGAITRITKPADLVYELY